MAKARVTVEFEILDPALYGKSIVADAANEVRAAIEDLFDSTPISTISPSANINTLTVSAEVVEEV